MQAQSATSMNNTHEDNGVRAGEGDMSFGTSTININRESLNGNEGESTSTPDAGSVRDQQELQVYAHAALRSDVKIRDMSLSSTSVSMQYDTPARLFGIIPMSVPARVNVNGSGAVNVSYPWYAFFFATNKNAIQQKVSEVVASSTQNTSASSTSALSAQDQARMVDIVHSVLQSLFGL